jgi:hypothetical protein
MDGIGIWNGNVGNTNCENDVVHQIKVSSSHFFFFKKKVCGKLEEIIING